MRRLMTMMVGVALVLALPAGAASAAEDATVHVVHGIPGAKVDVCVNGAEVRSNFKYGQSFSADLPEGTYKVQVRAAAPSECGGSTVIKATVDLTSGLNATAVALLKKGVPSLDLFVNDVSPTDAGETRLTVRHTASAPRVDVWANGATVLSDVSRGASADLHVPEGVYAAWVSAVGTSAPVIGPAVVELDEGMAYQVHAVGTKSSNYRFVVLAQAVGTT